MAIVLMILGFIWWWPIGLVVLAFLIGRRKLGYWRQPMYAGDGQMWGCDHRTNRWEHKIDRAQAKVDRVRDRMERAYGGSPWFRPSQASSGNNAFDEYRAETLKRLEDEQRDFKDFLGRLRFAKDRAEFDQFMTDRRNRPIEPNEPPPAPSAPQN